MESYESYLKNSAGSALPMEEALEIYENLVLTISQCKSEFTEELVQQLIEKAIAYVTVRARWELWDRATKVREDEGRTIKHNAVIDAFNILARLMNSEGIQPSWREKLGDERKRIGDFAGFMIYMIGAGNR